MRKLLLCFSVCIWTMGALFAQSDYYWYKGKKVPVQANNQKKYILTDKQFSNEQQRQLQSSGIRVNNKLSETTPGNLIPYNGAKKSSYEALIIESDKTISRLGNTNVVYEAPFYNNLQGEEAVPTSRFFVRLKQQSDLRLLEQQADKYHVEIQGRNAFMSNWYVLAATSASAGDALELANTFFETGLFAAAEPEFLIDIKANCVDDYYFGDQWGLKNTGSGSWTAGIDIKACGAWACTMGNDDVIVAVVDDGVQLDHPDLPNMTPLSYDAHTGTSPSILRGTHGTPCAGIIGAAANNTIGVAGVAPNVQIMSISVSYSMGSTASFADAINFAWKNGADVISNSWGYGGWVLSIIDDAVDSALYHGRGGLGTVVVFSTGNDNNSSVNSPAANNPDILAVGAMSPCGERKSPSSCDGEWWWGSNYGSALDIVAPGAYVPSTTTGSGYTTTFNGTSAAAPHIAGVAALIISADPSLSRGDIADIIELTAQKVGSYTYSVTGGRSNGTWTSEMGYGLVNAQAAVAMANSTDYTAVFGVPTGSAIPNGFRQYSCVYTLGCAGPDLGNVFNGVFNWWGGSSGLYQFTLETTDGNPRFYTDITGYATYSLHTSTPEISITSGVGFPGLEGDYWVKAIGDDIVLVSKSGDFALYFSHDCTPPTYRKSTDHADIVYANTQESDVIAAPNPFVTETMLIIPENMGHSTIMVSNVEGQIIETSSGRGSVKLGASYPAGMYLVRIVGNDGVRQTSFIKQ